MATKRKSQPQGAPRRNPDRRQEPQPRKPESGFKWMALLLVLGGVVLRWRPRKKMDAPARPSAPDPKPEPSPIPRTQPQGAPRPGVSGHETRDVSVPWILGIVGFLVVSGVGIHFILAGMLGGLNAKPAPTDRWRPIARASQPTSAAPPFPRLQISPPADLQAFRRREDAELNAYGWVNQTSGMVRIPIARAMDYIIAKGLLPVRQGTNGDKAGPSAYQLMQQRARKERPKTQGTRGTK